MAGVYFKSFGLSSKYISRFYAKYRHLLCTSVRTSRCASFGRSSRFDGNICLVVSMRSLFVETDGPTKCEAADRVLQLPIFLVSIRYSVHARLLREATICKAKCLWLCFMAVSEPFRRYMTYKLFRMSLASFHSLRQLNVLVTQHAWTTSHICMGRKLFPGRRRLQKTVTHLTRLPIVAGQIVGN